MHRRDLFQLAAVGGAALTAGGAQAAARSYRLAKPFFQARDGTELYWKSWGAGAPVVFVHSWGLSADMWRYQMNHLAGKGLQCVAYDRRGHGRSADSGGGYDLDTLTDDLATLIEGLDLKDITLVGHSMGTGEIARYLEKHGSGRVKRVALLSPTLPFLTKTADNPQGLDAAAFERLRTLWATDFFRWGDANKLPFFTPDTSPTTMDWVTHMMMDATLQALIELNRTMVAADFRPGLARIDRPTLVIQGDKDASAPLELTGRRTAALIPGAVLKVYEGAPHGLFVTHAARVNADLAQFIGV